MPLQKILPTGGVNVQYTPTLAEGAWSDSNRIRFKDGLAQKMGGWKKLLNTQVVGSARGSHAWADLDGNPYYAVGTDQRLQVYQYGLLYDITPVINTSNAAPNFSTVINTKQITIIDAASDTNIGDWINIIVPISVGGLILLGLYRITSVASVNQYTIDAASNATSTVNNGGAVPAFTTTNTSANVNVMLNNHGLAFGDLFQVQVATTVGGLTVSGDYYVTAIVNQNNFTIADDQTATSNATASENGGNAQIEYLLASGDATATPISGYGIGTYGGGAYGLASGSAGYTTIRQWFLDNWGQDLIGNPTNGTLYEWTPPDNTVPAQPVMNAPSMMTASFVSMPAQIMVALGAETGSVQDPNLIRWSDAGDNTVWTASSTNQAGSFRIPTGSRIVGGGVVGQQAIIWTDVDAWAMQYVGLPFVFSFVKIAPDCGLLAARAWQVQGNNVSWTSQQGVYRYNGGALQLAPCSVWDKFFNNYNVVQKDKIHFGSNHLYNEMFCFYPTVDSDEIDAYIKQNINENAWDFGELVRLTWVDQSVFPNPLSVDGNNYIQQHEIGYDDDGVPMNESIQSAYFDLMDGSVFVFVERCLPDFVWQGTNPELQLYIKTIEYPGEEDSPSVYGPYEITPTTRYIIIRARGRQAAIQLVGDNLGTFWRYGAVRFLVQQAGKR